MRKVVESFVLKGQPVAVHWLAWFLLAACLVNQAAAHLPDTSYARFSVAEDRFTAKLTYDVTSLLRMHPSLDANNNHELSPDELEAAVPTIAKFLTESLAFELNGKPSELGQLEPVQWPADAGKTIAESDYHAATSLVSFVFSQRLSVKPADIWVSFGFFEVLGLRHTVLGAIEKEEVEQEVLFTAFEPDYFFDTGYGPAESTAAHSVATTKEATAQEAAASEVAATEEASAAPQPRAARTLWSRLRQFFVFGVEHILIGYDHILFLLSLIIVSRFGELVKIVTSFTVAHSLTLALATLRWVDLPPTLVETMIAGTIVVTALENFWIKDTSHRWKIAFAFGLIHGFGFAGVLRDLELPTQGFVRSLLAFNLGVEIGQLAIVVALAWPISLLRKHKHAKAIQRAISALIALCGLGWFLDRAFALGLMPF